MCGRCGAKSLAGAQFCHACGQVLPSSAQATVSANQPAMPYPAGVSAVPRVAPPDPPAVSQQAWPVAGGAPQLGQPGLGAAGPYGSRSVGYNAPNRSGTGAVRPTGIAILAVVEIVIGLVGLLVVQDLAYWANWRYSYDDIAWGTVDAAMALTYVATSIAGFVLASRLWSMRPEAWLWAILLSSVLIGLDVFSVLIWGLTSLDIIGLTVHVAVLSYLNLKHVRGLFGRPPTTLFQSPS